MIKDGTKAEHVDLPKELITTMLEDSGLFDLDLSWIGSRPDVSENIANADCLHQARTWLEQCHMQHSLCSVSQENNRGRHPKRIIDVSNENEPRPRDFESIDTEDRSYVTCEHCTSMEIHSC